MSMLVPNTEDYVRKDHPYRTYKQLVDFEQLTERLKNRYSHLGTTGYPVSTGFKCLLLQYLHDLSDRELEAYVHENIAARYFCGLTLGEQTPTFSYFSKLRDRIGTKELAELFNAFRDGLRAKGLVREVFTFVDSSKLEACVDSWKARDKALADDSNDETDDDGNPTMNNKNVSSYSSDSDARYGAKGKSDIWLGYKRHLAVDMHQGLITKVAVTPANVHDGVALKHVAPRQGAVVADKAYSGGKAQEEILKRGLYSMVIKPRNSKSKDRDKDRFISSLRMPYEGVFSKQAKRARYRGKVKVQFQAFLEAFVHNLKRLLQIKADPVFATAIAL